MATFTLSNYAGLPQVNRIFEDLDLSGAVATRTAYIALAGVRPKELRLAGNYTYSAATDVQVAVSTTSDNGVTYQPIQSRAVASGTGTPSDFTDVLAVTDDATLNLQYDIAGAGGLRVIVTATSADGDDALTLDAIVS